MSKQEFEKIHGRPKCMTDRDTHYCPGCGHGVAHRLVAECIDEFGIRDTTIIIPPVGCAVLAYHYLDIDMLEAPHGRPLAIATAMKRMRPDHFILTYQGDGDLAAIGAAETLHAANRGEKVTTIFINNTVYGMTGGQMAPTTTLGQEVTTTPGGRDRVRDGMPMDISEMLALTKGTVYIERCSLSSAKNIRRAKKAIRKAFQVQLDGLGFSLVELLSPCPINWKMTPTQSREWIDDELVKTFPLKVIKDTTGYKEGTS
jgi:2-oxoglutarate ferredoxin oxidoreductase subunit beta